MKERKMICGVCEKETDYLEEFHDRHGFYSGKACSEKCGSTLPGQGQMWNYDAEEPLHEDTWPADEQFYCSSGHPPPLQQRRHIEPKTGHEACTCLH